MTRLAILILLALSTLAFAEGPNDRQPTDPHSITSASTSDVRPVPVEDLFYSRRASNGSWSSDGKEIVFTTDMTGNQNVWKISANGSFPIQMSYSRESQDSPRFSHDGQSITYRQDSGGNEMWQLLTAPAKGGAAQNRFEHPDAAVEQYEFSPDGSTLAIIYKPKTASSGDIALLDWNSHSVRNVTNEKSPGYQWSIATWFPDGKAILAQRSNPAFTDSSVFRIDIASGHAEELTPHDNEARFDASSLSADGRTALLSSNQKTGSSNIALLDIATRKISWVTNTGWEAGMLTSLRTRNASPTNSTRMDASISIYAIVHRSKCSRANMPEGPTTQQADPDSLVARRLWLLALPPERASSF